MPKTVESSISEEEYLENERASETKHEYYQGEIFAMAGASEKHNLIVSNVIRELGNQLRKKPCRVYPGDMKLKIKESGDYVYPDIMVVCGERKFLDDQHDVLLDVDLIAEVLSDSTEAYDRGKKFAYYRKIDSLKEYVLISQQYEKIEKFIKNESGFWVLSETNKKNQKILLESIDCKLNIGDVYEKVFE